MSQYLEEAAALLRSASQANEKAHDIPGCRQLLIEGRERIARQFATLAAIDKGLLPADITQVVLDQIVSQNT